jgi:hypothetical protein
MGSIPMRRRGESALRNLASAARVIEGNPALMNLPGEQPPA